MDGSQAEFPRLIRPDAANRGRPAPVLDHFRPLLRSHGGIESRETHDKPAPGTLPPSIFFLVLPYLQSQQAFVAKSARQRLQQSTSIVDVSSHRQSASSEEGSMPPTATMILTWKSHDRVSHLALRGTLPTVATGASKPSGWSCQKPLAILFHSNGQNHVSCRPTPVGNGAPVDPHIAVPKTWDTQSPRDMYGL